MTPCPLSPVSASPKINLFVSAFTDLNVFLRVPKIDSSGLSGSPIILSFKGSKIFVLALYPISDATSPNISCISFIASADLPDAIRYMKFFACFPLFFTNLEVLESLSFSSRGSLIWVNSAISSGVISDTFLSFDEFVFVETVALLPVLVFLFDLPDESEP